MTRFATVLIAFALALAACGVERSSDEVVAASTSAPEAADDSSSDDEESAAEDAAEGEGDGEEPETPAPIPTVAPTPPPTTGVPTELALTATFDGEAYEITHGELNEVVVPTQENAEFVGLVFGGARPPGFEVGVLTENLVSQAVQVELDALGVEVTDDDRATARDGLIATVETLFAGQTDPTAEAERLFEEVPYLPFLVEYQARQDAFTAALSDVAEPGEGAPCVSHILVETESEAEGILAQLADGGVFADLAAELSTGPSGPNGGELGCASAENYVPEFADAVNNATLGEYVGPVETEFGWHILVVDRFEVDGRELAGARLRERLAATNVDVDAALGNWDTESLTIVPAGQ